MLFQKATKEQVRLRMALVGPSGSGKTYTALNVGQHLGGRVAVIDSEHGSARKYADTFNFDVLELDTFSPLTYVEAISAAAAAGYDVLVVDSLSHAWTGKEGALEQVDIATARGKSGNKFADGWREVTPMHNQLIDAIIAAPLHVIATMRVKTEYVIEENDRGKKVPVKVGLAPVQRSGMEYEFDIVGDIDHDHRLVVTKSRCAPLADAVISRPGKDLADTLAAWLSSGAALASAEQVQRMVTVTTALDETAPNDRFGWLQIAEAAAQRDHARGLALLTGEQYEQILARLEEKLVEVREGSGDGPGGSPDKASRARDAAADTEPAHAPVSSPPDSKGSAAPQEAPSSTGGGAAESTLLEGEEAAA